MTRKLRTLIGALLLALAVTTGAFAYTYNVATTSMAVAAMGGNIAASENASSQPDWNEILPVDEYDSQFLLPMGPGDLTNISSQYPNTGQHWSKLTSQDDFTSYVYTDVTNQYQTDLYQIEDNDGGEGKITSVSVYFRISGENTYRIYNGYGRAVLKIGGEVYYGTVEQQYDRVFDTRNYVWTKNPVTGEDWTWSDIDAIQAGVALRAEVPQGRTYCTMVYVRVDYRIPPRVQGDVPPGDLFEITPHPMFTGDLTVNVYLTNVKALIKAYKYLNMKIFIENSLEAEETPDYHLLTLENGMVNFNIEGGAADNYTIQLIGGSYKLVSSNSDDWVSGWEVVPEFYCEISQRG
ncbi:MAG: hypothetical protein PHR43_02890 [Dehalococcoidales bacterium]|nr:hypothetical protein [Dehalococcoidales bacterium]